MPKRIPVITRKMVANLLPQRPLDSHKGMFGAVTVIGGATGMTGAPLLAARAALKMGTGSVHVGLLTGNTPQVDWVQPELMLHSAKAALQKVKPSVIAIGCGLGTSKEAQILLYEVLKRKIPVVLDADALNLLAINPDLQNDLQNRSNATVLTPHPGEAARLLGCETVQVQSDRVAAVQQLVERISSGRFSCSVVLKGAGSLCVTNDGKLLINNTGNPGMSSPGMGDVLTGMIAAFIAQGISADDAMLLGVYLHGAAADELAEQGTSIGMTATDITEWARWLLNQLGTTRQK